MRIALALTHPGEAERQAVAILLFIYKLTVDECIRLVDGSLLDDLIACNNGVDDMHILSRRTYLESDGRGRIGKLVRLYVEPVIGLSGRTLIFE